MVAQRAAGHQVWQTALHNPDFSAYARLCGARGLRVTTADALDGALAELFDHDGPGMVEIVQDPLAI